MAPLVQGSDFCRGFDPGLRAAGSIKSFFNRRINKSPGCTRNVGD